MSKTHDTQYHFSHRLTTSCAARPQVAITELTDFTEVAKVTKLIELAKITETFLLPIQFPYINLARCPWYGIFPPASSD